MAMTGVAGRMLEGNAYAHETITVADTAIGFTTGTCKPSSTDNSRIRAFVTVQGGFMRYRYDGSDPTTTVGHIVSNGDTIYVEGTPNIEKFRAIRIGDTNGTLSVTYERVSG